MTRRLDLRRHHTRLLFALLVAVVAVLQPLDAAGITAAPGRMVQRETGSGGSDDATIRLIQQSAVVEADGDFSAFLEVEDAPEGSDLAIDLYPLLDDEDLLDDALAGDLRNSQATFPVVDLPPAFGSIPVQTGFVINLYGPGQASPGGGWAKRLVDPGVYPVRVRLRGPDTETLATLVTFLVRAPGEDADEALEPATVALVPEISSSVTPEESVDLADTPLPATELSAIDSLVETFGAHPDVPASFVVPADLARRLAAPDSEATGGPDDGGGGSGEGDGSGEGGTSSTSTGADTTQTGGGSSESGDVSTTTTADQSGADEGVVGKLRALLVGDQRELLTSTFVDVDPTELVASGLTAELRRQLDQGFRDLADVLEPPVGDTWVAKHPLSPAAVDALAAHGVTNLLVPPRSISGPPPPRPFRLEGTSGRSRATVLDPELATGGATDPVLAAQRLVGHTIARSMIDGGAPQLISVPLPASIEDVAELDALLALLPDHDQFLRATTVSDLIKSAMTEPDRFTLDPPDLGPVGSYSDDFRSTRRLVDAYASMIPDRPDLAVAVGERLSRSATAGLSADARSTVVGGVRADVEARFAEVTIPTSDRVTLGARDAQFPLVISSESDVPLRVVVDLTSASDRLVVKQDRIEVLLDSDRTVVPVQLHSRSPGDTPIKITVSTLDGHVILSEGTYSVRSTAVSGMGLLLTVGAGLFLAVWWGRHFMRARRSSARHAR